MDKEPTYDLERIKELVRNGARVITLSALAGARELGLDEEDVDEVVLSLEEADFYKTMPAQKLAGLWQDVYRPMREGIELYVKLQISSWAVVISFKRK
jgi:motility quorum-sensing regulator / GCU-specific mRNA interferase toxin